MTDIDWMNRAIDAANLVRCVTSPKPWVGCVIVSEDGEVFTGSTFETNADHAETVALNKAGQKARGANVYVTLEPCSHQGTTPPCADALIAAGVSKVFIGIQDVDQKVLGRGIQKLQDAKIQVEVGVLSEKITKSLAPYIKHRTTGRPYVVAKVGMTLDGFIADEFGKSKWITGRRARENAHELRAQSDAIVVGANTVRKDDPSLNIRDYKYNGLRDDLFSDPLRVVLGQVDSAAKINPCQQMSGELGSILETLGKQGVLQVLVEGGAQVLHDFHIAGLVDRYVFYVAPAIFGGASAMNVFGQGSSSAFDDLWRGEFDHVEQLGSDIRIDCVVKEK